MEEMKPKVQKRPHQPPKTTDQAWTPPSGKSEGCQPDPGGGPPAVGGGPGAFSVRVVLFLERVFSMSASATSSGSAMMFARVS